MGVCVGQLRLHDVLLDPPVREQRRTLMLKHFGFDRAHVFRVRYNFKPIVFPFYGRFLKFASLELLLFLIQVFFSRNIGVAPLEGNAVALRRRQSRLPTLPSL